MATGANREKYIYSSTEHEIKKEKKIKKTRESKLPAWLLHFISAALSSLLLNAEDIDLARNVSPSQDTSSDYQRTPSADTSGSCASFVITVRLATVTVVLAPSTFVVQQTL